MTEENKPKEDVTETKEEILAKKVEQSFVKEDAKPPVGTPVGSFTKEKKTTESSEAARTPTMGEVLLYIGKQDHEINMKMDSILDVLKLLKSPSQTISDMPLGKLPSQQLTSQPPVAPIALTPADDAKLAKIKVALIEFADKLEFDGTASNLVYLIRAKMFLGSDNFAKIAGIIRSLGGQYVSQGKQSHFEVSKAT
jgi:hypothetical protein